MLRRNVDSTNLLSNGNAKRLILRSCPTPATLLHFLCAQAVRNCQVNGMLSGKVYPPNFRRAMSDSIKTLSDASFQSDVLDAELPVLVDYWAAWCGPCKMIAPILEEAAGEYAGRVTIGKLNVDDNPDTPARFGVRGIPTLMLFKDGKAVATKVGALSKPQLAAFLEESL